MIILVMNKDYTSQYSLTVLSGLNSCKRSHKDLHRLGFSTNVGLYTGSESKRQER